MISKKRYIISDSFSCDHDFLPNHSNWKWSMFIHLFVCLNVSQSENSCRRFLFSCGVSSLKIQIGCRWILKHISWTLLSLSQTQSVYFRHSINAQLASTLILFPWSKPKCWIYKNILRTWNITSDRQKNDYNFEHWRWSWSFYLSFH